MNATTKAEAPIAIEDGPLEVRVQEIGGGMSAGFFQIPAGADLRPALVGLTGDMCQCPHWGYLLKGELRMHTPDGEQTYGAGQAFYWAPGHAPEALEDCEYVDFSPSGELEHVLDHLKGS